MWSEYRASYAPRYQSALCVLAGSWRTPLTPTVAPLKTCRNAALSGGTHDARGLPFLRLLLDLLWRVCGPRSTPTTSFSAGLSFTHIPARAANACDAREQRPWRLPT